MKALVLTVGAALLACPTIGIAVLLGSGGGVAGAVDAAAQLCLTSGPVTGLSATQAHNARSIVAAALQAALTAGQDPANQQRGELIVLMTAATESTLHNYSNPDVPASELVANDGPPPMGGDHDSVGLFQQRASWGPVWVRMDPLGSTRLFMARLLAVPAWQSLPPGVAAQTVQQSKYPDRYAHSQTAAQSWLQQINASPLAAASCGAEGLPQAGGIRPGTEPAGYSIPATATDAERRAITFALAQLGKPYVFGAVGPDSYDCSGLTMAAWAAAGVRLPHYTVDQYHLGAPVAASSLLSPGDLIFIPGSDGSLNPPNPQHVGMYLGDGLVIEAPHTNDVVKIMALDTFGPIIGIRHLG